MVLKNEDINLLIKMENLIGMNEKRLFGKNKDKKCTVNWYDNTTTTIDFDDFISFMNLIERALQDKQKASDRANNFNKTNKEYHRITCNIADAKRRGNMERYEYWKQQLIEYKQRKEAK
jgi:hypothetical protein